MRKLIMFLACVVAFATMPNFAVALEPGPGPVHPTRIDFKNIFDPNDLPRSPCPQIGPVATRRYLGDKLVAGMLVEVTATFQHVGTTPYTFQPILWVSVDGWWWPLIPVVGPPAITMEPGEEREILFFRDRLPDGLELVGVAKATAHGPLGQELSFGPVPFHIGPLCKS